MKQKPTRAPIANEAGNGLKNTRYTVAMARTSDPHSATAQFFINVADNDFLDHKGPSPQGWGYCVFGKVTGGQDVVDKIKGVTTANSGSHQNVPTDGRRASSAPRKSHKADAVRFRPPPVAGATRAGGGVRIVLRRVRRARRPASTCSAISSTSGSATTSCASRWRRASRPRCAASPTSGVPVGIIVGQPRLPHRPRDFAEAAGATLLPEQIVVDVAGTPTLLMHGDELCTSDVAYQRFRGDLARSQRGSVSFLALPYGAAAWRRATGCGARAATATAVKPEAILDVEPAAVDAAFREAGRRADHPRPYASSGAPSPRRRRPRLRSATCSPTGTTAAPISNSTPTAGEHATI